jgi:serine/threonine protein phosphatase 1
MITLTLAPASLPPGRRVYAVGDVHGCAEQLATMHALIADDLRQRPVAAPLLIHLGDYIDRGPASAAVLARLLTGPGIAGLEVVDLIGNHEAMLLEAIAGQHPDASGMWLANGGIATLESWGVTNLADPREWRRSMPPDQLALLRRLPLTRREGGYLFVHAGIRPRIPLDEQTPADLLWIREPFLSWPEPHPAVVVHGHTPVHVPVVRANRIGIDTGAVMGGVLTCLVLEADRLGFLEC